MQHEHVTHTSRTRAASRALLSFALAAMLALFAWPHTSALAVDISQKDTLQAEADDLFARIDALQTELEQAEEDYATALARHSVAVAAMEEAQARIDAAAVRTAEVQERLGERAIEMYKGGGDTPLIEVMLGSASFEEFVASFDMFTRVASRDASLVQEAKDLRAEAEAAREEFEKQALRAEDEMHMAEILREEIAANQADLQAQVESVTAEIAEIEAEIELQAEAAAAAAAASQYSADYVFTPAPAPAEPVIDPESGEVVSEGTASNSTGSGAIFANPCPAAVTSSGYGWRAFDNSFHKGTDMAAPMGSPYYAAESGTVIIAGFSVSAGNWIVISHGNGLVTKYMHSSALHVKAGDRVQRGQHIGDVGSTGYSTGPHLHFQVELNGQAVCPYDYL